VCKGSYTYTSFIKLNDTISIETFPSFQTAFAINSDNIYWVFFGKLDPRPRPGKRESGNTVLYLVTINIILLVILSYIIIKLYDTNPVKTRNGTP
jgi:hypothetical protein